MLCVVTQVCVQDADREFWALAPKRGRQILVHALVRVRDSLNPAENPSLLKDQCFVPTGAKDLDRRGKGRRAASARQPGGDRAVRIHRGADGRVTRVGELDGKEQLQRCPTIGERVEQVAGNRQKLHPFAQAQVHDSRKRLQRGSAKQLAEARIDAHRPKGRIQVQVSGMDEFKAHVLRLYWGDVTCPLGKGLPVA